MTKKDFGTLQVKEHALSHYTYQDYLKLPDDQRHEILEGELILLPAPGTAHQKAVTLLTMFLASYVRENRMGEVSWPPMILCSPRLTFFSQISSISATNTWI